MTERSRLPLFVLAAALAILFHRLFIGEAFYWGLPSLQFIPWRELSVDMLRAGQLPLWNPYNGMGAPLFANYQSSLLYPLSWFSFFLPIPQTMSITAVIHLFIAGWGMWHFTGRLSADGIGRGLSALAFGLAQYLVARTGTFPIIQAAAWLPWMAWAVVSLIESGRARYASLLALFTGLLLLAGHAQTAWYSLLLTGVIALYWAVREATRARQLALRRLGLAFVGVLLGVGIAALQLLATGELLLQSQRSTGVNYDFAMNYSYAPARALNLIAPNVFGTPADGSYITGGAYFEDAVYIGLLPLASAIAAIIGWFIRRRDPERPRAFSSVPLWIGVVIAAFVLALGRYTPIFPFLFDNIPTFDLFQAPVRWHLWTVFALSTLAGIGASAWGRGYRLRRWTIRLTVACGGAVIVALVALTFFPQQVAAVSLIARGVAIAGLFGIAAAVLTLAQPPQDTSRHIRWGMAVFLVVAADLVIASWGLNPTIEADFYDPIPAEAAFSRGYFDPEEEDALKFGEAGYFRFDNYTVAAEQIGNIRVAQLPNFNIIDRVALINNFDPLLVGSFADYRDVIPQNESALLSASAWMDSPRVRLLTAICWHESDESLRAALLNPDWNPTEQAHLLGDAGCAEPQVADGTARITLDTGSEVIITLDVPRDSWLILADTPYPGWSASVDDEGTPIYAANLNARAVQVDAGAQEVRFVYHPWWLLPGALISIVSLVIALLLYRLGASEAS